MRAILLLDLGENFDFVYYLFYMTTRFRIFFIFIITLVIVIGSVGWMSFYRISRNNNESLSRIGILEKAVKDLTTPNSQNGSEQTGAREQYLTVNARQSKTEEGYEFECDHQSPQKLFYIKKNGEREFVSDNIDAQSGNEHPGDCFSVVSSDAGGLFDRAKILYLSQSGGGDAGTDGYFEYDLNSKTLQRSVLRQPSWWESSSLKNDFNYEVSFGPADSDGEVRILQVIDFRQGTSTLIGHLPKQYTYIRALNSNDLIGAEDAAGEIDWSWYGPVVSVYSSLTKVSPCGSNEQCRMRAAVFKQGFYLDGNVEVLRNVAE